MWSMWDAPSDRDYYDPNGAWEDRLAEDVCLECGARDEEACEEWCESKLTEEQLAEVAG